MIDFVFSLCLCLCIVAYNRCTINELLIDIVVKSEWKKNSVQFLFVYIWLNGRLFVCQVYVYIVLL